MLRYLMSSVALFLLPVCGAKLHAQQPATSYNTDSLLHRLSGNKRIKQILHTATIIYKQAHIDTTDISPEAFQVAYLQKKFADNGQIHLAGLARYKKKRILTVVDYTRPGNRQRMVTVDLVKHKVLHQALVTQGSGTGEYKNDKYCLPTTFSNELNSQCSSPGLVVATRGTHPDNPCHLCRFTLTRPHDCVVVLEGLEPGINDNLLARDVVIHTTGSLGFTTAAQRAKLHIGDPGYCVTPEKCTCYTTSPGGGIKGTDAYASVCGIAENGGYMGQSNGCLVLPEENHIAMMQTVKNGSLIFIYTNAVTESTNYFRDSPIMKKIVKLAARK
jgi:hypothetical protein